MSNHAIHNPFLAYEPTHRLTTDTAGTRLIRVRHCKGSSVFVKASRHDIHRDKPSHCWPRNHSNRADKRDSRGLAGGAR